jgi:hypothetical protein
VRLENSFIPVRGVGEATERKLWQAGVTHWSDFDGSVVGQTRAERIETFIDQARDRLADDDAQFFDETLPSGNKWRLYENFESEACYFDIETTGLDADRHDVTTVSFHTAGDTTTLVQGDDLTAGAVREQFQDANLLVTFNGARFDVPFLETALDLSVETPHLDLMYPCRQLGLSGGLKAIEKDVGVDRDEPDISGEDAVRLWHEYQRGKDGSLETLISYNRDDARNLETLADTVAEKLHDEVFDSACAQASD